MATASSASAGTRAVARAGQFLSSKHVLIASSCTPVPGLRQLSAVKASGHSKLRNAPKQETDRSVPLVNHHRATRSLVYRDVKMFLNEIGGDPREARYWLTQFQNASTSNKLFAVVEMTPPAIESCDFTSNDTAPCDVTRRESVDLYTLNFWILQGIHKADIIQTPQY